jgi:hypothetical protein
MSSGKYQVGFITRVVIPDLIRDPASSSALATLHQPQTESFENTRAAEIHPIVRANVSREARLVTDEAIGSSTGRVPT